MDWASPCESYGRKRAKAKSSKDTVPAAIEGIAEMDGDRSGDSGLLGIDVMKSPLGCFVGAFEEGVGGRERLRVSGETRTDPSGHFRMQFTVRSDVQSKGEVGRPSIKCRDMI
jgi:hypothetical protein